jgi:alpha-L-rhamnosidase
VAYLINAYPSAANYSSAIIKLGEELYPANDTTRGGLVMVPTRAAENYTSRWSLVPTDDPNGHPANQAMSAHEFNQFRYAEIVGSPVPLTAANVRAWVVQYPFQGTGVNPFETPCAVSTPNLPPPTNPRPLTYGTFTSSSPGLDAVFNLTAYTAIATSLDINVDSQTRQRDLCHIDALITAQEQYAIFPSGDYALQRRTFRDAFANDSAAWAQWTEFKQSSAIMPWLDAMETGDLSVATDMWASSDTAINSDAHPGDYVSLQFMAGVRYFNLSGSGLLHYPADCGGSWHCDPLVDWPTGTRDGYVISATGNMEDAVRNGLGAVAIAGLSQVATWLGYTAAAARYADMVASIRGGLLRTLVQANGTEAYFTDGVSQTHAAVHSTIYGVASGAADGNASLSSALAAYLIRRDVVPSSCMTGRWYVQAMYQLGIEEPAAADYALWLLSRDTYPSWGNMILRGATTTLEAWAPEDKWNTDWSHPWCAAPAFLIPRWLMGIQPTSPAWATFVAAPQPGNLTQASVRVPTPAGPILATFSQDPSSGVTLAVTIPTGIAGQICLPPLHASFTGKAAQHSLLTTGGARQAGELRLASFSSTASVVGGVSSDSEVDALTVDGVTVAATANGRMLCTVAGQNVGQGVHTVVRKAA